MTTSTSTRAKAPRGKKASRAELADDEFVELVTGGCTVRRVEGVPLLGLADDDGDWRAVHALEDVLEQMMKRDGMSRNDAVEFFSYNLAHNPDRSGPIYVHMRVGRPGNSVRPSEE